MPSELTILTDADIDQLDLEPGEVLLAVERGLVSQAEGTAHAEPTVSFKPLPGQDGLLSVIRGINISEKTALIKTVGTYPNNPARGLPANPGLALLCNAATGEPIALIGASRLTTLRTAAVTALGAKLAARPDSRILGCVGSRGIALQAALYIARHFELSEIRVHSREMRNAQAAAETLTAASRANVLVCGSWNDCLADADIMIDGASHARHESLFPGEVLQPGATLLAYGAYASASAETAKKFDRVIMDRWVEGDTGAFGPSIVSGLLDESQVAAMMGDVIAGRKQARTCPDDCILVWQRGLAACDIALAGMLMLQAKNAGAGSTICF